MLKGASLDQVRPVYCGFILIERNELRLLDFEKIFEGGQTFVIHKKQNRNLSRKHGMAWLSLVSFYNYQLSKSMSLYKIHYHYFRRKIRLYQCHYSLSWFEHVFGK